MTVCIRSRFQKKCGTIHVFQRMNKRVAMITVHECPLASSEGKERGGINVYTFELSKALSRLGWQVDAYTRVQDDVNPRVVVVNDNFRVIHIESGAHTPLSKKEILATIPEFTRNVADYIRQHNLTYNALHGHYYLSGMVGKQLNEIQQTETPLIMTFHTLGLMKQLVARSKDTDDPPERIALERDLVIYADSLITSSDTGKEYLASLYDAPENKIITIPPGVDTKVFRPIPVSIAKKHIHADTHHKIILAVGRIDPVKGFDVLLVSLKMLLRKHPDYSDRLCLWIVGGDVGQNQNEWSRELKKLDSLRKTLHLSATVKFVTTQSQEELPYYYSAADVLVMPSHYESFGMVALEAIACGTQVIATDVTGISPILKELPQGHIVSANNPLALSEQIKHVIEGAPHPQVPAEAIRMFDWNEIASRVSGVYAAAGS